MLVNRPVQARARSWRGTVYSYNGRARQVNAADMSDPDGMIIAMSAENMRDLRYRYGDHPAPVSPARICGK